MYEIMAPDVRENASGAGVLKSEVKNLEKRKKRNFFFYPQPPTSNSARTSSTASLPPYDVGNKSNRTRGHREFSTIQPVTRGPGGEGWVSEPLNMKFLQKVSIKFIFNSSGLKQRTEVQHVVTENGYDLKHNSLFLFSYVLQTLTTNMKVTNLNKGHSTTRVFSSPALYMTLLFFAAKA